MSGGTQNRRGGGSHGRHMTEEEAELWTRLKATTEPLRRGKARVVPARDDDDNARPIPPRKVAIDRQKAEADAAHVRTPIPVPAPKKPAAPPIAGFERRVVRKVAGGQIEIDARLDLHGLKAEEARHRLRGFILDRAADGLKIVLVITGKGRTPQASDDVISSGERGVLRRLVPLWLAEHDLRHAVLSFTSASARHGGEGALYVRLRRRRR